MGMHNFVIIPVLFNSLLLLCTADSTGCASRLRKGICRGGSSWQPRALRSPEPRRCSLTPWCCCAPEERLSRICLCTPAAQQDPGISLTSNSWHKHDRQDWMLLPFRCLESDRVLQESRVLWGLACAASRKLWTRGSGEVQRALLGTPVTAGRFWSAPFSGSSTNPTFSSADLHLSKE